jgi:predicted RNA-binding protein with PUA-like domain
MPASFWLVKSDPGTYGWPDLVREKRAVWDGVRNAQARIHLSAMRRGDRVLVYHSGDDKAVVGIARVMRGPHPDPKDGAWVAVDLAPVRALREPVPLARIKAEPELREIDLVRQSRLSVMPLPPAAAKRILRLGGEGA